MKTHRFNLEFVYLLLLSVATIFLRVPRFEVFKIYTDSYKYLLIANATFNGQWIDTYYPTFLQLQNTDITSPYKWLFGIVVGITAKIATVFPVFQYSPTLLEQTAHWLVILSSVGSIFFFYKIFQKLEINTSISLGLLTLFTFSGVDIIWSGFIITDTFAAMVILLFIYVLTFKQTFLNVIALLLLWGVMYITRVELGIAGLGFLSITSIFVLLTSIRQFRGKLLQILLKAADLIFLGILLLNTFSGNLVTSIFQADLLFWVLLFGVVIWSLIRFLPAIKTEESQTQLRLNFTLKLAASLMMMVYYVFNKDMGRYVLLVLPYFYIIMALEFQTFYAFVKKKFPHSNVIFGTILALCFILFTQQITYTLTFPKYALPDYHSEVSSEVIEALDLTEKKICESASKPCSLGIKPILYVAQQDPYLWANFDNKYEVRFLSRDNYNDVIQKALAARSHPATNIQLMPANPFLYGQNRVYFLEDPSLQYKDAYFEQNANFTLINEVAKTKAPFWVNGTREKGWYRVWYVGW